MNRITFDGRTVRLDEISHQHLSNIYWFNKLLKYGTLSKEQQLVVRILVEKWNANVLRYLPHPNSKQEISLLDELGYLEWYFDDNGIRKAKIFEEQPTYSNNKTKSSPYYDNKRQAWVQQRKQIGEVCEIEWLRQDKLSKILL